MNTSRITRILLSLTMLLLFSLGSYAVDAECEWTGYKNGAKVSGPTQSTLSAAFAAGTSAMDSVAITLLKSVTLSSAITFENKAYSVSLSNPNNDTITVSNSFLYSKDNTNYSVTLYDVNVKGNAGSVGSFPAMVYIKTTRYFQMIGGSISVTSSSVSTSFNLAGVQIESTQYNISRANISVSPASKNYFVTAINLRTNAAGTISNSSISVYGDVKPCDALGLSYSQSKFNYGVYAQNGTVCNMNFNNIVG